MSAAIEEAGCAFTIAQGRVLASIGPDGTRIGDLAEPAGVTKQTATFPVNQLEKAGYVERVPDPAGARARLVRLSEAGAGVAVARKVEVEAEWVAHLGEPDAAALRRALERLREVTGPYR
ncbi:MarR family winged helix-turn-helix transcriptional regulator [Herbidospora galbida]|uniref:MarR family winged helix-turn-helix transcriptional regulator n=1 Tax=Herbidospora galbida TaxID=2575442 RepID=UPI001FEA0AAF|nr:MarR family winged helix-turn-helix transcriptional regulator [Herbidospora galbida]